MSKTPSPNPSIGKLCNQKLSIFMRNTFPINNHTRNTHTRAHQLSNNKVIKAEKSVHNNKPF